MASKRDGLIQVTTPKCSTSSLPLVTAIAWWLMWESSVQGDRYRRLDPKAMDLL